MIHYIKLILPCFFIITNASAQIEPEAGTWKTWFISSGKDYRLAQPPSYKEEIAEVISQQSKIDSAGLEQIQYWNAGTPGYRWLPMMYKLWMSDTSSYGTLANLLIGTATYDAMIAAWDTKYAYNRPRPFEADSRIKNYLPNPNSPSYPCEHSVAAGVGATLIAHFFPSMKDSVSRMAQRVMTSRIAAGAAFPSDTRDGFELGKRIAEEEIKKTIHFIPTQRWDGLRPDFPGVWKGEPMAPMAGHNKTVVLNSSNQFRPGPPPDFAKEMEELKNHKPNFRTIANAFLFGSQSYWEDLLHKKIFEYNIHLNPPRAARMYAITYVTVYDAFAACWDAKYTYWGTRPDQYDTTFTPVLIHTPPFPGYPSGHAVISGALGELYSSFFPAESVFFRKRAKDGAESRFQGGIHFRSDNEVGLELGRKVAWTVIERVKEDGSHQ